MQAVRTNAIDFPLFVPATNKPTAMYGVYVLQITLADVENFRRGQWGQRGQGVSGFRNGGGFVHRVGEKIWPSSQQFLKDLPPGTTFPPP